MKKSKVLLIGWDAADWKIISPLLDSGQMPALKKLIENGVMGNIATLDPPLSPMLWTSIATGVTADKHGILGFAEPDSTTGKIRPVSGTSRKVKAVWNILMQEGYKAHCVGWWPSHPAEPLNGVAVSDFFATGKPKPGSETMLPEQAIHPPELRDTISKYKVNASEITAAHLLPFVPRAARIDQEKDLGLQTIASLLAKGSSYHAVTTWILENQEWDFLALYLNEIDVFCHTFMKFSPPKQVGVTDEMFENYSGVVDAAYRFHDMMLERLMELAGDDTTIILLSDHGFLSGDQRKPSFSKEPAGPAEEHANYGMFCMRGPGIKKDERVYGVTLLDIAPTILSVFGLPAGKDMAGKIISSAFETAPSQDRISSWESVAGNAGQYPADMREDPWAASEALAQLVGLGYLEAPEEDQAKNAINVTRESQFYLARVYLTTERPGLALPILEKILEEAPGTIRYGLRLIQCCNRLGKFEQARSVIDQLRRENPEKALATLDYLDATILLAEHKPRKALAMLLSAESRNSKSTDLYLQLGQTYIRLQRWSDAERAFVHALSLDSENARAHHGLALASLRQNKFEVAIDEALTAVALLHHFPAAHYHLGEALMMSGDFTNAIKAFSVCLSLRPNMRKAHLWLADIFETKLVDLEKAKLHHDIANKNFRKTIYVVSGLPRSGTSMMMQMLKAGGLEVVSDNKREGDDDNPQGYLEDERVKRFHLDQQWIGEAEGKVLKVVAPLVMNLPQQFDYKIIFMERDMHEVLTSQQTMLGRHKQVENKTYPVALADAFAKQLEKSKAWLTTQPQISVLFVNYAEVISAPEEQVENVVSFLGLEMQQSSMIASVNAALHRNKR